MHEHQVRTFSIRSVLALLFRLHVAVVTMLVLPAVWHAGASPALAQALDSSDFVNDPSDGNGADDAAEDDDNATRDASESGEADQDAGDTDRAANDREDVLGIGGGAGGGGGGADDADDRGPDSDGDGLEDDDDNKNDPTPDKKP
jgi:hypothetical protein